VRSDLFGLYEDGSDLDAEAQNYSELPSSAAPVAEVAILAGRDLEHSQPVQYNTLTSLLFSSFVATRWVRAVQSPCVAVGSPNGRIVSGNDFVRIEFKGC
jgi:hypothetical protein